MERYTVKQLATLAGVSVRTLHYYDEIALLRPAQVAANGYRYYTADDLLRLQHILFYRELGLELLQIKDILDQPQFDTAAALQQHRAALAGKIERLQTLMHTVDHTLNHLQGATPMSKKQLFKGFSAEQEADYARQARLRYDPQTVRESQKRWQDYSADEKNRIMDEGNVIYTELAQAIDQQVPPETAQAQALMARWHAHIRYFYEPTTAVLRGLGELYVNDADFGATFKAIHVDLARYMQVAIAQYVDDLEHAELERLLAEDEDNDAAARGNRDG
jgi:MerR family transcriptional regulator, thiopeptide resistance regulator